MVKAAEARARSVVDAADAEARRLKLEAEDFCDQRLASFEIVLERTMKVVSAGRAKLQGSQRRDEATGAATTARATAADEPAPSTPARRLEAVPDDAAFFDQDDD